MNLSSLFAGSQVLSGRFYLVSITPIYISALFVMLLVWGGAPGDLNWGRAWRTAAALSATQALLLVLVITVIAFVVHPLQTPLVRVFQGSYWPQWLAAMRRNRFTAKRTALLDQTVLHAGADDQPSVEELQMASAAHDALRRKFPPGQESGIRPTALGNAIAAGEERAGMLYGFDAAVMWPRLYVAVDAPFRAVIDDARNQLDVATRLSVSGLVTAVVCLGFLAPTGWPVLLFFVPLAVSVLAYVGAIQAAQSYGQVQHIAFDLFRFRLLKALHLELPRTLEVERSRNEELCRLIAQGPYSVEARTWRYEHDE